MAFQAFKQTKNAAVFWRGRALWAQTRRIPKPDLLLELIVIFFAAAHCLLRLQKVSIKPSKKRRVRAGLHLKKEQNTEVLILVPRLLVTCRVSCYVAVFLHVQCLIIWSDHWQCVSSDLESWERERERGRRSLLSPHCGDITPSQCVDIRNKTPGVCHLDWVVSGVCVCVCVSVCVHWYSCTLMWRCTCLAVCLFVCAGASPSLPGCVHGRPCVLSVWTEITPRLKPDVKDAVRKSINNYFGLKLKHSFFPASQTCEYVIYNIFGFVTICTRKKSYLKVRYRII